MQMQSRTPQPTLLIVIWPAEEPIVGGQWGGVGSLSAWVLSNIPLFNQAYCWLALRYTVMRYFFHTLDFALETQGSNKFTVVSDMQFCFLFLFLFLFLFDPRGETDLTAALLF